MICGHSKITPAVKKTTKQKATALLRRCRMFMIDLTGFANLVL
jgi:hypothetical protein